VRSWGLSSEEQDEVWVRWRRGESLRLIARRLGKRGPSVRAFVLQTGGVEHCPPRRAERCLSMAEREEISRGVAAGEPCRQIAARLGRAPSTVSRELTRNGGRHHYRAQTADAAAFRRAQRPKAAKLVTQPRLRAVVEAKLALRWSPQQIAGWLPLAYPQDPVMRVSHETIHLSLFVQSRGALRRELQRCLRTGRAMRYPRGKRLPQGRGAAARHPRHQPATRRGGRPGGAWALGRRPGLRPAAQRGRDLGRAPQPLCAAVPTPQRLHCRRHAPSADRCRPAAAPAAAPLPYLGPRQGDGRTPAIHHRLWRPGLLLRPTQPWQRGTNQNTNGLLRQYLPKSADLRQLDQAALDAIAAELNGRPRQTLGFKTPSQALAEALR
jgi:IS30 family transposase